MFYTSPRCPISPRIAVGRFSCMDFANLCGMSKAKTIAIVLLVAGGVWWFTRQAARVDIGTASLSFLRLEKNGIKIKVKIPILNRSQIGVNIEGFLGSLRYRGNILGNITLEKPMEIAQRSAAEPEFVATLPYGSIATELWDFLSQRVLKATGAATSVVNLKDFSVVGTLYVSGLSIDLNEKIFE